MELAAARARLAPSLGRAYWENEPRTDAAAALVGGRGHELARPQRKSHLAFQRGGTRRRLVQILVDELTRGALGERDAVSESCFSPRT